MKWRWILVLAAIPAVLAGMASLVAAGPTSGGGWQVIVLDQVAPASKSSAAKWASLWSDGKSIKRIDDFVLSANGRMWTLNISPMAGQCSCKEGKFPFSYNVDQLIAVSLAEPKERKVLMGDIALESAKAVMRDHEASCDGIKALPGQPDTTESYERSKMRLLSSYNGQVGLELVTESSAYGRPVPMVSNDWAAYRLDKDPIGKVSNRKALPAYSMAEASNQFSKLPAAQRDPFAPGDFGHFVFAPSGGGVAVEFGVPGVAEAQKNQARVVRVEVAAGLNNEYDKMRQAFKQSHGKLIPWEKASFYAVAPDQSAVVYAENGKLYWQAVSGKAKPIGQVKQVRGWQWHRGAW